MLRGIIPVVIDQSLQSGTEVCICGSIQDVFRVVVAHRFLQYVFSEHSIIIRDVFGLRKRLLTPLDTQQAQGFAEVLRLSLRLREELVGQSIETVFVGKGYHRDTSGFEVDLVLAQDRTNYCLGDSLETVAVSYEVIFFVHVVDFRCALVDYLTPINVSHLRYSQSEHFQ